MIEVEKKFRVTDEQLNALLENAEFLGEKVLEDTYFDDDTYSLTTTDTWLRDRGGSFELKISRNSLEKERVADSYKELETVEEIANHFGWEIKDGGLHSCILDAGYTPCITYKTFRKKYKKRDFAIDVDVVDFGFKQYTVVEVELLVEDESEMEDAVERILEFAREYGLDTGFVRGKAVEYISCTNQKHFDALKKAGFTVDEG